MAACIMAPLLLFEPAENFVLTAKYVEFGTQWDAGVTDSLCGRRELAEVCARDVCLQGADDRYRRNTGSI
jgi:hypothetical protein